MGDVLRLPRKPARGDRLEVVIEGLDHEGQGTAALDAELGPGRQPRRFAVRVRKAVPGDRLRLVVERCRRGVIEGHVDELLVPSAIRVEPRCPHFGQRELPGKGCGGCSVQSVAYAEQLSLKRALVERALAAELPEVPAVAPALGMDEPWHYRNKMEFSFGDTHERRFALGLHPVGFRYEVLDLSACYLLSPFAAPFALGVKAWAEALGLRPYNHRRDEGLLRTLTIREGKRTGQRLVELTTSGEAEVCTGDGRTASTAEVAARFAERAVALAEQLGEPLTSVYWTEQRIARGSPTRLVEHLLAGAANLEEELHLPAVGPGPAPPPLRLQIHPRAFFQPNTLQAERLYAEVIRAAGIGGGGVSHALDLYCGTGTIGLCLAAAGVERVTGIELSADAVGDARLNAERNGLTGATFFAGDTGKVLRREGESLGLDRVDLVVVDPPRSGLLPAAVGEILRIGASRLVYVSCNPRALGRDLALLCQRGYALRALQPVDLFPHTPHVETVATLART